MTQIEVFAPAKINLALHVTGQRADGYHLLDTLVAFADVGDGIGVEVGTFEPQLSVSGPEATPALATDDNIMWQVARRFAPTDLGVRMHLEKNLPLASGIGGGSADAAAVYRGLRALAGAAGLDAPPSAEDRARLLAIGADVPMCALGQPARIQGIGEVMTPLTTFPSLGVVLINPRQGVSTPAIFGKLAQKDNASLSDVPSGFAGTAHLLDWLAHQRNDLEGPAREVCPAIDAVLVALAAASECRLARMSGSGATCFGLFETRKAAFVAADLLRRAHPDWWVQGGSLYGAG